MTERGRDGRWALIIGGVLAATYLVCYVLVEDVVKSYYVDVYLGLPGYIAASTILGLLSGNPHGGGGKLAYHGVVYDILIIAVPVNFLVYSALSYFVLRITSPLRRRRHRKGQ